jgi:hypothetical protein
MGYRYIKCRQRGGSLFIRKEPLEMNRSHPRLLLLVLLIVLLAIPTMAVLAKELGLLTISGPGIKGEITLNDAKELSKLEGSGFFDQPMSIKPPENLGDGYNITAHLNLDGKMVPLLQGVYYPGEAGQAGYWHVTGRLNGEELQPVDQWGQMRPEAENAFRSLMTANKITLQPAIVSAPAQVAPAAQAVAEPALVPVVSPPPTQTPYVVGLVAAILVLVGTGLTLRRRAVSQRSA